MQTCVIISNLEKSVLPLVKSLAENEVINLILLSDSSFLLNDSDLVNYFDYLEEKGVKIFITKEDLEKRGFLSKKDIYVIDYEMLVDILVSENMKVFNF